MSLFIPTCSEAVLIVVDLQPSFLRAIHRADEVVDRAEFLLRVAQILDIPRLATVQNPERMGGTDERLEPLIEQSDPKMAFSCARCASLMQRLESSPRKQAVLVGIETHICVSQTAHHFLAAGYEVAVCADAVSARTPDRHQIGLERIRDAGAAIVHTESIAYEWLGSADHPKFREALAIVKQFA